MMKNKLRRDIFVIIFLLLVACIALAVPLAFSNPRWLLAPALLVVFALVVAVLGIRRLRRFVADMLCGTNFEGSKTQYSLADFSIPTALITEGSVVWYNPAFREQILAGQDALLAAPDRLMTGIDLSVCARAHGQDLTIDENRYTAYATTSRSSKTGTLLFLVNDTFYKNTLDEYTASRPAYLIIGVDSYDELFNDMKDSEQAHELEAINTLLEEYIGRTTGFLRKVSNSRYIAVVEERDIRWMMEERFDILDKVRALHPGGMLTLSIGVGHGGATMQECQEMARESIDIALGRGGDQAAVKTVDGFEFFGGSVNVSNLVAVSCSDDSFDWTEGWNGKGTNLVAYQEDKSTLGYDCDCLMECDNNGSNNAATPVAHPVLKNLILVGNGGSKQGIRLRAGPEVEIDNAKVCGKGQPLTVETALTENALKNGTSKLTNITLTSELSSKEGIYTHADFIAVTSNKVDANLSYSSFEDIRKECSWMNGSWVK